MGHCINLFHVVLTMSRLLPSNAHALFLNVLPGFAKHSCVYLDSPRGRITKSCLPGISVNKTCCKNTAFCHCNVRRLIAATHDVSVFPCCSRENRQYSCCLVQSGLGAETADIGYSFHLLSPKTVLEPTGTVVLKIQKQRK